MDYSITKDVLFPLGELGVTQITVMFSGGGDSGQIDGIYCSSGEANVTYDFMEEKRWQGGKFVVVKTPKYDIPPVGKKTIWKGRPDEKTGEWVREEVEVDISIEEAIEEFVYNRLSETDVDWYNNEGGQGEFIFKLGESKQWEFDFEVQTNYRHIEIAYSSTGPVAELEEDV